MWKIAYLKESNVFICSIQCLFSSRIAHIEDGRTLLQQIFEQPPTAGLETTIDTLNLTTTGQFRPPFNYNKSSGGCEEVIFFQGQTSCFENVLRMWCAGLFRRPWVCHTYAIPIHPHHHFPIPFWICSAYALCHTQGIHRVLA